MHEQYMQRCIELAQSGLGFVAPNPMVGSVIVHNNRIIGEGCHQQYGQAHAEVNAINSVINKELLKDSTIYVNLEPCSHFGKTPPCADLIIQTNIPRVVIGNKDPFPKVNGSGIEKLQKAGVEVISGIEEEKCHELNRRFFCFHQKMRPYIILKWAQTAKGIMARMDRNPVKISSDLSHTLSHKWRTEEQAILIGSNTAIYDNAQLTSRLWKGNDPIRILIDKRLSVSAKASIYMNPGKVLIFNGIKEEIIGDHHYIKVSEDEDYIGVICKRLYEENILSVIIEGGAFTLNSFLSAGLWDEAGVFSCPDILSEGIAAPIMGRTPQNKINSGPDLLYIYRNKPE